MILMPLAELLQVRVLYHLSLVSYRSKKSYSRRKSAKLKGKRGLFEKLLQGVNFFDDESNKSKNYFCGVGFSNSDKLTDDVKY
mmetsp:Transcript_3401/g.3761  ORF Transcript_3401/g.3761 Transcript_3401/m.3761 type:complete len:83 (-) Transcript_3401:438-686(-)